MDIDVKAWLQAINMLGTFGLAVWLYLEKRSDNTNARVSAMATKVADLDKSVAALESASDGCEVAQKTCPVHAERIASLEASLETAPTHADLSKLYDSLNNLATTVHQLVGENRGQTDTLRLILNQITQKGMR